MLQRGGEWQGRGCPGCPYHTRQLDTALRSGQTSYGMTAKSPYHQPGTSTQLLSSNRQVVRTPGYSVAHSKRMLKLIFYIN